MPSYSFPKALRLVSKSQFKRIALSSNRITGQYIIVQWVKNSGDSPRLGITASRKFGKAHERNRFKRMARESFRLLQHCLPEGIDIVIKPRSKALEATSLDLIKELEILCEQVRK